MEIVTRLSSMKQLAISFHLRKRHVPVEHELKQIILDAYCYYILASIKHW